MARVVARCGDASPLPRLPGVYVLLIRIGKPVTLVYGGRRVELPRACALYVGSARGPGGLEKRVERHWRRVKKTRWHIDVLTTQPYTVIEGVVFAVDDGALPRDAETRAALCLEERLDHVPGFGSTDDRRAKSHLFIARDCSSGCRYAEECLEAASKPS